MEVFLDVFEDDFEGQGGLFLKGEEGLAEGADEPGGGDLLGEAEEVEGLGGVGRAGELEQGGELGERHMGEGLGIW